MKRTLGQPTYAFEARQYVVSACDGQCVWNAYVWVSSTLCVSTKNTVASLVVFGRFICFYVANHSDKEPVCREQTKEACVFVLVLITWLRHMEESDQWWRMMMTSSHITCICLRFPVSRSCSRASTAKKNNSQSYHRQNTVGVLAIIKYWSTLCPAISVILHVVFGNSKSADNALNFPFKTSCWSYICVVCTVLYTCV